MFNIFFLYLSIFKALGPIGNIRSSYKHIIFLVFLNFLQHIGTLERKNSGEEGKQAEENQELEIKCGETESETETKEVCFLEIQSITKKANEPTYVLGLEHIVKLGHMSSGMKNKGGLELNKQ